MSAKKTTGGVSVADVAAILPQTFFVKRGDIQHAFGLTKDEVATLIAQGIFAAKYPFGRTRKARRHGKEIDVESRARFTRSQVLAVAQRWESSA